MKVEFSRKVVARFLVSVVLAVLISFIVHFLMIGEGLKIVLVLSYALQLLLSIGSFLLLSKVALKKGEQTGFFFLGLSALKFLIYVVGFRLYFIQDGEVSSAEYAIFFIPYIIAFSIEVGFLISILNGATMDPEKIIEFSDEEE